MKYTVVKPRVDDGNIMRIDQEDSLENSDHNLKMHSAGLPGFPEALWSTYFVRLAAYVSYW